MENNIPESINPCPIIDAILEIRFSSNIPPGAIFGIIFNSFKNEYTQVENLPISQLPELIRNADPNLKFKPHYKISSKSNIIQVGPEVFTISQIPPYSGWEIFSNKIYESINKLKKLNCIKEVNRLGMRYINFFSDDIFNNIDLNISFSGDDLILKNTLFRTEIESNSFTNTLQIANNLTHKGKNGSIIDIDTFTISGLEKFLGNEKTLIEKAHSTEKELFFSLLKKTFLEKFNPKY